PDIVLSKIAGRGGAAFVPRAWLLDPAELGRDATFVPEFGVTAPENGHVIGGASTNFSGTMHRIFAKGLPAAGPLPTGAVRCGDALGFTRGAADALVQYIDLNGDGLADIFYLPVSSGTRPVTTRPTRSSAQVHLNRGYDWWLL